MTSPHESPQAPRRTLIKICGLTRMEDVEAVNAARPDLAGFILSAGYRRSVGLRHAVALANALDPSIAVVGVFVNEPPDTVASFTHAFDYDGGDVNRQVLVQLHGDEGNDYIAELPHAMAYPGWSGIPIIKAFTVRTHHDVELAQKSVADYVLLDNGRGTGKTFDWSLLQNVGRSYFLAGGLGPHNVASAIERAHPLAVDMSSGVETNGIKDPNKIAAAVAAVRSAP